MLHQVNAGPLASADAALARSLMVALVTICLSGCSPAYQKLEAEFGVESIEDSEPIPETRLTITSHDSRDTESFDNASIRVHASTIEIEVNAFLSKPLMIGASDVAGCSMTCFGGSDRYVNILVAKTGSDLMIPANGKVLDWCWDNKRPILAASVRRSWKDRSALLPKAESYVEQFTSRDKFNKLAEAACLGY